MSSEAPNCWEYMACGLEPGGTRSAELGVCPAATDAEYDGINRGKAAGRFCWSVDGTLCHDATPQSCFEKFFSCVNCPFYLLVEHQEGTQFIVIKRQIGKHPH